MMKTKSAKRGLAAALALVLSLFCALPAGASGGQPDFDEAYYATLDYYGGLLDSSVVKSYITGGSDTIVDYGTYDEIINLTDDRQPAVDGGKLTFDFQDGAPSRFYFEGKTARPYQALPWRISLSYRLNGVETPAEKLAGAGGLIEINLDVLPNLSASKYSRNNLVLTAAAAFNADDILSLEAPGAEVQLIGNLRTVLFMVLPGEEQHFTIRVGAEDFSFSGMILLAVPATLSQLEQVADLREAKEDIEDSYDKLTDAMDKILDSLDGMSGSLNATANGLDQLNSARGQISSGKHEVYGKADLALEDLENLAAALEPMNGHLDTASQAVDEISTAMGSVCDEAVSLQKELKDTRNVISSLKSDLDELDDFLDDVSGRGKGTFRSLSGDFDDLGTSLKKLQKAMSSMKSALSSLDDIEGEDEVTVEGMTVSEIETNVRTLDAAYEQYAAAVEGMGGTPSPEGFYEAVLLPQYGGNEAAAQKAYTLWQYSKTDEFASRIAAAKQVNSLLETFNMTVSQLQALTSAVSEGAAPVMSGLDSLCTALGDSGLSGDLSRLMDTLDDYADEAQDAVADADEALDVLDSASVKADKILEQIDALHTLLDSYIPDVQDTLKDSQNLITEASGGLRDLRSFLGSLESLLKNSGSSLDAGTRQTLSGLADALRRSTIGLDQTENIRTATDVITDLIEDKWDSYTGEENNLLLMDVLASPESMTSAKNGTPSSIQYIMRTQEIKVDDSEDTVTPETDDSSTTFFGRVAQIFIDFWNFITGFFK